MSYTIYVLSINQDKPVYADFLSQIILHNEIDHYDTARYWKIYQFFSNTPGILYSLVTEYQEDCYFSFPICDGDFEMNVPEKLFASWISCEARSNMTPLIIHSQYYEEFVKVIHYLIETAPQKRILFHTSYQCYEIEVVMGVIKEKEFFAMLDRKEILFNVSYIVEGD